MGEWLGETGMGNGGWGKVGLEEWSRIGREEEMGDGRWSR